MKLSDAVEIYQAQLEHFRAVEESNDLELIEQVEEDLSRARAQMEVIWLEEQMKEES